jgi:hypothetical protein
MDKDKHVQAYDILLTERSRIIERNYRHDAQAKNPRPEKDGLCLRCHSMDADAVLRGQYVASSDGIGCERCHGPAEKWLSQHYLNSWKQLSLDQKETLGFHDNKDLRTRARVCAECHIGSGDAQVDHDLYGAGHPRLYFEMASFVATMPPHWSLRAEKARHPDLEAREWAIGQVVCAQTALELLQFRATEKNERPWPEFAEYECYSCHHDLTASDARQKRGYGDRVPGTLPWNEWYYVMPQRLAGPQSPLGDVEVAKLLGLLSKEMSQPLPDREQVLTHARAAAQLLGQQATALEHAPTFPANTVRQWFDKVWGDRQELSGSWDRSAQGYLSLAALHATLSDLDPTQRSAAMRSQLKAMAKGLQFPRGVDSPRGLTPPFLPEPKAPAK